jgi:hypothetical protein
MHLSSPWFTRPAAFTRGVPKHLTLTRAAYHRLTMRRAKSNLSAGWIKKIGADSE